MQCLLRSDTTFIDAIPIRAVAARTSAVNNPPPQISKPVAASPAGPKPAAPAAVKNAKKGLKGVVVKKKPKTVTPATKPSGPAGAAGGDEDKSAAPAANVETDEPTAKRRKLAGSGP